MRVSAYLDHSPMPTLLDCIWNANTVQLSAYLDHSPMPTLLDCIWNANTVQLHLGYKPYLITSKVLMHVWLSAY